jgi:hypothetical protein
LNKNALLIAQQYPPAYNAVGTQIGEIDMFFAEFTDEEIVKDGGMNFVDDDIPADERVIASSLDDWENPNHVTVFEVNE